MSPLPQLGPLSFTTEGGEMEALTAPNEKQAENKK